MNNVKAKLCQEVTFTFFGITFIYVPAVNRLKELHKY